MAITESILEDANLGWLKELGWIVLRGPDIAPGEPQAERETYADVLLVGRLQSALERINPEIPAEAIEDAIRKLQLQEHPTLTQNNHRFHRFMTDGVPVDYQQDGHTVHDSVQLIDEMNLDNNDWVAVNQFTVIEDKHNRRPDIVVFVNGLPLGVIELKNPVDEKADIYSAYKQFQTYKAEIPSLFTYNEALVISDGVEARVGSLTALWERFMPWRTIEGEELASEKLLKLEVLIKGVFDKRRLLELVRHFNVFEHEKDGSLTKKLAGYHQFHAVRKALATAVEASRPGGDRRAGVVWHTQGSGKSLTMLFFAGQIILEPSMENPTIVVLTDRNDLDDQLFGTFARCHELLRQKPVQAEDRAHLRKLLSVAAGGVVFTTIQKFLPEIKGDQHPELSPRRNIIVIADEAHRSQYDFIDGFARHMRDALPRASFIGFTGTPIELTDANTRQVFGDYISVYDIQRAVHDGATVPIYYESRLANVWLDPDERPRIDPEFEEATEGEEISRKERLKTKWAATEALVGSEKRIGLVAEDLTDHFASRLEALDGKAMIVCMSRRICVDMYNALVKIKPHWHHEDDKKGALKVVMTGSATDSVDWQQHIRNKPRREDIAERFKDPDDPLRVVIVRDMWLTGFDVPCLHTMYVDKPMRNHGLMQAIARVNRVFKDKPGGLVVDYLGLAENLKKAMATYTESGGSGETAIDQEEAVAVMLEKYEVCCDLFHGFDWSAWITGTRQEQLGLLPPAQNHVLSLKDGKNRCLAVVSALSKTFALAVPHPETTKIRDDVGFFQAVRAVIAKTTRTGTTPTEEIELAIRQIVSKAISSKEVIDVFSAAGLKKPDISILSDEFLAEVRALPYRNLAVELLQKLLRDEIQVRSRKNVVQSRSFAEMLEKAVRAYQNRAIETAAVIEELIDLAKDMREAQERGEKLGLSDEELAFYDALAANDSAVQVLGDKILRLMAHELVEMVRKNVTIDWTIKESVRAKLRAMVKRILRKHGYPPDLQETATLTVLEQAEAVCRDWVA